MSDSSKEEVIHLALPKGHMQENIFKLLEEAGMKVRSGAPPNSRSALFPPSLSRATPPRSPLTSRAPLPRFLVVRLAGDPRKFARVPPLHPHPQLRRQAPEGEEGCDGTRRRLLSEMCARGTQSARGPARGLGGTAVATVRGTRRRAGQGRTAPPGKAAMIDVTSRGGKDGSGVVLSPLTTTPVSPFSLLRPPPYTRSPRTSSACSRSAAATSASAAPTGSRSW